MTIEETGQIPGEAGAKEDKKLIIDVSRWNGSNIDWPEVAKTVSTVFVRAGNGLNKADPMFLSNAKGAIQNGLKWGAYFFFNFLQDPFAQAKKFIATVEQAGTPTMPLVLDIETNEPKLPITGAQLEDYCHKFLGVIESEENEVGGKLYDTAIYLSPGFSWFLPKNHTLGKYKLWVADYNSPINKVNGWQKPWLHQYTDKGNVKGIIGNCDLNRILD